MKKIFALGLAVFLASCAGTPIDWDKARDLKIGMSESDVTSKLGQPYSVISKSDGTQLWIWTFATAFGGAESVSVGMRDGKVTQVPIIPASFR